MINHSIPLKKFQTLISNETIIQIVTCLLIMLFVYAAGSKLVDYRNTRIQLGLYPWISHFSNTIAWANPAAELMTALGILIPRTKKWGFYASLGLLLLYTIYLVSMVSEFTHLQLPCTCGGVISTLTWRQHIFFNLFFISLSIWGIRAIRSETGKKRS